MFQNTCCIIQWWITSSLYPLQLIDMFLRIQFLWIFSFHSRIISRKKASIAGISSPLMEFWVKFISHNIANNEKKFNYHMQKASGSYGKIQATIKTNMAALQFKFNTPHPRDPSVPLAKIWASRLINSAPNAI